MTNGNEKEAGSTETVRDECVANRMRFFDYCRESRWTRSALRLELSFYCLEVTLENKALWGEKDMLGDRV